MSRPILPSGMRSARTISGVAVGLELVGHHDVDRHVDHVAVVLQQLAAGLDHALFKQRIAHRNTLGGKECEAHAAADDDAVGLRRQVLDDRQLVRHLRAAEHHRVRPLGRTGQLLEDFDLGGHQCARVVRQQRRDLVDRRLLAVHNPEAVGDESAVVPGEFDQLFGQGQPLVVVLAGLARVETNVLQQQDVAVGQPLRAGQCVGTDHVAGQLQVCRPRCSPPAPSQPAPARASGRVRPWAGPGAR